ncbi:MAG: glutathione S-transferase family protein [Hyphomicrobiaceae bacterium]|nr:glutathione S-transferase family protein [Hyphomicrobiaceae bacterium]
MLTLLGNLDSGNVHKVQMILHARAIPFRRVDVRQDRGQPRDPRFLAVNSMGKVPAVCFDDGDMLSDSGALLFHFAQGTPLWPSEPRVQAEVLRWMFFEQYSHEPALAVLRYLKRFAPDPSGQAARIAELTTKCRFALDVLDERLRHRSWVAADGISIADLALYPYTRLADEIGLDPKQWASVAVWLARIEACPRHLPVYADAAVDVIPFENFFAA